MHHLYLDPLVFACPRAVDGVERFNTFLDGVLLLRDLRTSGWAQVFVSQTTTDILFQTARYPLQNDLHGVLSAFDSDEIQAKDVIEIVNGLLQRTPTLEEFLGIDAILFEGFRTTPNIDLSNRVEVFQDGIKNILILSLLVRDLKSQPESKQIIVTRDINAMPLEIDVQATILDTDGKTELLPPYHIHASCRLCQNWDGLNGTLNPEELWQNAIDEATLIQALKTYVWAESRRQGLTGSQTVNWMFGPRFINTARQLGFLNDALKIRTILRACAETVLESNMRATHALRTGRGGDNPQRKRGNDKAWRRDIDHEFHLHYWETMRGIEFSCVVVHNDFDIIS